MKLTKKRGHAKSSRYGGCSDLDGRRDSSECPLPHEDQGLETTGKKAPRRTKSPNGRSGPVIRFGKDGRMLTMLSVSRLTTTPGRTFVMPPDGPPGRADRW